MHLHRLQKEYILLTCLLISVGILCVWWWRERVHFSALTQYQLQLTQLQQLATAQSGNDALRQQTITHLNTKTQELLQLLPPEQATKRSATQSTALAGLLFSGTHIAPASEAYTHLTSQLMQAVTLSPTKSTIAHLLALRQQYAQLVQHPQYTQQLQRIQHNVAVIDNILHLRARQLILSHTHATTSALEQTYEALHLLLNENKRLISFLEQATITGGEHASLQELLTCRADLVRSFRREQQDALDSMTLVTLAQSQQMQVFQQCISARETCLTQPYWYARHTGIQDVSSGVVVLAQKYAQLHLLREKGAPLDAQQLCVRRNKLPQTPADIQQDLERALEQQQQLGKVGGSSGTGIDQSGNVSPERFFDNRQENALQEIELRKEQWLEEVEGSSGTTFRDRIEQFFEQFDGKR